MLFRSSPYVIFRAHSILGYTTNLVHYVEDAADTTTCRRFRCGLPCPKADAQRNTDRLGLHLDVKFLSKINILNVLMCSPGFCLFFLLLRRIEKYLFGLGRLNVQQYEFFARPTLHWEAIPVQFLSSNKELPKFSMSIKYTLEKFRRHDIH